MRQAQFVAGRGLQGIARHAPRSAREAKEVWEAGANIQTKVLGLDKAQVNVNTQNNTQINVMSMDQFIAEMVKRKNERNG